MPDSPDPIAALRARIAELDGLIAPLVEERERLERALTELTSCKRHASSNSMPKREVVQAARIAMARGQSKDDLVKVASDAGMTLRALAQKVGCSGPLLTQARKGVRSISMELAQRVQAATRSTDHPEGFAVSKTHWPLLRP